ncbi:hypothetical protein J6590_002997 [Homalodisca vitripennis]|nr:hypothetical protein J6590_002997 [Homalodisca vitripennis]
MLSHKYLLPRGQNRIHHCVASFYSSSWPNGLCEDLNKHYKEESRYSVRSITLVKCATATDRI